MSDEAKNERSEAYGKARAAFDALKMEERASFLVDAAVSLVAKGVGEAGRAVSDVLDEVMQDLKDEGCCGDDEPEPKPEAAEPEPKPAKPKPAAKKPRAKRATGTSTRTTRKPKTDPDS